MSRKAFICILIVLMTITISDCGKKGLPTSPDRWSPKLTGAVAVDRTHVNCYFSERMLENSFSDNNYFSIISEETGETLKIITVVLSEDLTIAHLTTFKMDSVNYILAIDSVTDMAGNLIKPVSKNFKGTLAHDTTAPELVNIIPTEGLIKENNDTLVFLKFSEPMDTELIFDNYQILPQIDLNSCWEHDSSFTEFVLRADTLNSEIMNNDLYYLAIFGFKDIEGNAMSDLRHTILYKPECNYVKSVNIFIPDSTGNSYVFIADKEGELRYFNSVQNHSVDLELLLPDTYSIYLIEEDENTFIKTGEIEIEITSDSSKINLPSDLSEDAGDEVLNILNLIGI